MYKVKVNDNEHEVSLNEDLSSGMLNGKAFQLDAIDTDASHFHVLRDDRSYRVELVSYDRDEKTAAVKVNGELFELDVKDRFDILLEEMGLAGLASQAVTELKAPMPGLILEFHVKEGDEVKKGDPVLVLEAMKMENVIKAPADVTVSKIVASKGDAVEKNQTIISFQ